MRHTGLFAQPGPDGTSMDWVMDWVLATTENLSGSGIMRACADCGEAAYTSVRYPDDIPILCEVCAYERLVGKAGGPV